MQVILATDGSVESDIAAAVCKRLPFQGAKTTVVSVTGFPIVAPIELAAGVGRNVDAETAGSWRLEHKIARQMVDRAAEDFRQRGFEAESLLIEGDPGDELLRVIREQDADLILAGCGVSSSFAAFILGSVARKLVLYSQASVLLGRRFPNPPAEGSCHRIAQKPKLDLLVAFDGSPGSRLALQTLSLLQTPVFGNVYVATIEPYAYMPAGADLALYMPASEEDKRRALSLAEEVCPTIQRCADRIRPLSGMGRPSEEICKLALERDVDLVMMGANRPGAFERIVLGSCAYETALGAPCPVLILRDVLSFAG